MKKFLREILLIISSVVVVFVAPASTYALTPEQMEMFAQNNILFYDPGNGVSTYSYCGTMTGSTIYEKTLSALLGMGLGEIAVAGIYGNLVSEGLGNAELLSHENGVDERKDIHTWYKAAKKYGENGLYVEEKDVRNLDNPDIMHGMGFSQWSFGARVLFLKELEAEGGLDVYAREWDDEKGRYTYDGMKYDKMIEVLGADVTDQILQAELNFFDKYFIKNEYAKDGYNFVVRQNDIDAQGLSKYGITAGMKLSEALNLLTTPEEAAELFFTTGEMPGRTTFSDNARVRGDRAKSGLELIKNLGLTASGATNCNKNSGNIVETAMSLAWEGLRSHSKNDPKPEYVTALKEVDNYVRGNGYYPYGASCDQFVSTVMRYSGADSDFPKWTPSKQQEHMETSGKYEEVLPNGDFSILQPGDIFVTTSPRGHIYIYLGDIKGDNKLYQASASADDRTGEYYSGVYFEDKVSGGTRHYRVFRLVK